MKKILIFLVIASLLVCAGFSVVSLYKEGKIRLHYPSYEKYPVRGVDVSNYQGDIDWKIIADQNISFAFIKSTEGSSYVDAYFEKNWENVFKAGIRAGAYHFFSFDSSGKTQAELFIKVVKPVENMLPPVIDVEPYGDYILNKKIDVKKAKKELRVLVDMLEEHYGVKPIIYCSFLYDSIIKKDFDDCELWYRSVYLPLLKKKNVVFWQYSDNHVLDGYYGDEKFIDMNVFMGSKEEFYAYPDNI